VMTLLSGCLAMGINIEKSCWLILIRPILRDYFSVLFGYLVLNNSIGSIIEVISMHKKDAPNADQLLLNVMERINYLSNDFIVYIAIERLFGR
jgi:hypothetical protein